MNFAKKCLLLFIALIISAGFAACGSSGTSYQFRDPVKGDKIAVIKTTMGEIRVLLFEKDAPKAVENFTKLAEKGYYNGLIFHRVIKDTLIQGGDPKGDGTGGESIWGKPFEDEFTSKLHHYRGAVSMANSGADTNGSQFFIVASQVVTDEAANEMKTSGKSSALIKQYQKYGGMPWLDNQHTIFGQVVKGIEVVDKISEVSTVSNANIKDKPLQDVKINSVEIITQ